MHVRLLELKVADKGSSALLDYPSAVCTYKQKPEYLKVDGGQPVLNHMTHEVSISGLLNTQDVSTLTSMIDRAVEVKSRSKGGLGIDGLGVLEKRDKMVFVIKSHGIESFNIYKL